MSTTMFRTLNLLLIAAAAANCQQPALPELKIEPKPGGSILIIRNTSPQALTAYLIELVDYPGSAYALWQDDIGGEQVQPGAERKTEITNMTVGAVPDYVKMRAAIYADGSTAGIPGKVAQLVARRKAMLATTRELIGRVETASSKGTSASDLAASLNTWADTMQPQGKPNRNSQAYIDQTGSRALILANKDMLGSHSVADVLAKLKASEQAMVASKPAL